MRPITFLYNSKQFTVKELCVVYKATIGEVITPETMLYRIKTKGVNGALNFTSESKNMYKYKCNGQYLTCQEIAVYLGLTYNTFMKRKSLHGIGKAIAMGGYGV